MTGSGGSGILIARKSDGTWSPPSGIMLHTPTLSFIIGVDVYDCVLVINSLSALESITRPRVTLGEDVGMTSGPLVPMDPPGIEMDINLRELGNTVLTYMKSRGQEQLVNLNGCILTERANENERFYESSVTQMDVLSGNVSRHVEETQPLSEVIKLAEGRTDFDPAVIGKIAAEPAPGDANIASPNSTPHSPRRAFGIPQADDPDPFGVLALEMAGMEIREAGSRLRPASSQMDSHTRPPSRVASRPASSTLSKNYRQSGDTFLTKSNRESYMSSRTVKSQMTDAYTQTDTGNTPETSPSPSRSEDGQEQTTFEKIPERRRDEEEGEEEIDYTTVDLTPLKHLSHPHTSQEVLVTDKAIAVETRDPTKLGPPTATEELDRRSKASSHYGETEEDEDDGEISNDDADDDEEPVVFEVAAVQQTSTQAVASRMIHAKGNMVTIPKRIPPPLPARNPARASMTNKSDMSGDVSSFRSSLLHQKSSNSDLNGEVEVDNQKRDSTDDKPRSPSPSAEATKIDVPENTGTDLDAPQAEDPQLVEAKAEEIKDPGPKAEGSKKVESDPVEVKAGEIKDSELKIEDSQEESTAAAEVSELTTEDSKAEELQAEDSKVEEPKVEEAQVESSKTEELKAEGLKPENSRAEEPKVEEAKAEDLKTEESKENENLAVTPADEEDDVPDPHKKTRLSIDTGATDARSSFDESSYTTPPTSERHMSLRDDEEETPKKLANGAEQLIITEEKREIEEKHQVADGTDATVSNGATAA